MPEEFTIPEDYEFVSFKGVKMLAQPDIIKQGWFRTKSIPQKSIPKHVEEATFPAYDLKNFDSYVIEVRGEFDLLAVNLYTNGDRYSGQRWVVAQCLLLNAENHDYSTDYISIHVNGALAFPRLVVTKTHSKTFSGEPVRLSKIAVRIEFPTRDSISRLIQNLDSQNSITIAKLAD